MKKLFFFLFAASAVVFSACNDDSDSSSSGGSGGGGGGSNNDSAYFIKWTRSGTNYNVSTATSGVTFFNSSDNSIGFPTSCYSYSSQLYNENNPGVEAAIGFSSYCFDNADWGDAAFYSIFEETTYPYALTTDNNGAVFYFSDPNLGVGGSTYTTQTGSSNFTVTDVQQVNLGLGYPAVAVKGTFNCKLDDGSTITNGTFRVLIEDI